MKIDINIFIKNELKKITHKNFSKKYITQYLIPIIKHVNADEYVYIPHRGESKIELDAIKNVLPVSILKLNLPIELISLEAKIYPLSISHTLSTAVFSMRKIYDAPIYTYRVPNNKLIQRKELIENLYNIIDSD